MAYLLIGVGIGFAFGVGVLIGAIQGQLFAWRNPPPIGKEIDPIILWGERVIFRLGQPFTFDPAVVDDSSEPQPVIQLKPGRRPYSYIPPSAAKYGLDTVEKLDAAMKKAEEIYREQGNKGYEQFCNSIGVPPSNMTYWLKTKDARKKPSG